MGILTIDHFFTALTSYSMYNMSNDIIIIFTGRCVLQA